MALPFSLMRFAWIVPLPPPPMINSSATMSPSTCAPSSIRTVEARSSPSMCLNRYRGKEAQQKVTVEHVDVHAGGQAVVGMVESPRGGDQPKSEDQPRAKQIGHAPQPAVWSADKERQTLPVSGDAERPLPNARRDVPGRPKG